MSGGFGLENLPYGVVAPHGGSATAAVRIGDQALDLRATTASGLLDVPPGTFDGSTLNTFLSLGRDTWAQTRARLSELLGDEDRREELPLIELADCEMALPVAVGDYVDFYSSIEHASNIGRMFRPDSEPLLPNWRQLPVGYHGRAGTVVVSGTPVRRPCGQRSPDEPGGSPSFGPERRLDIELELGFITGDGPELGTPIAASDAADHIFGFVLVNDWSAREIQRWEYQPLGPFLGKSFATSISPWIVPLEALTDRRVAGPAQDPPPLGYLRVVEPWSLDVDLEIGLKPAGQQDEGVISQTNARGLYWNAAQQLAHATVNGASVAAGDLFASGTISGPQPGSYGSLIELSWGGRDPIEVPGGTRTFLEDGDEVTMRGVAGAVSFGEVRGRVLGTGRG